MQPRICPEPPSLASPCARARLFPECQSKRIPRVAIEFLFVRGMGWKSEFFIICYQRLKYKIENRFFARPFKDNSSEIHSAASSFCCQSVTRTVFIINPPSARLGHLAAKSRNPDNLILRRINSTMSCFCPKANSSSGSAASEATRSPVLDRILSCQSGRWYATCPSHNEIL